MISWNAYPHRSGRPSPPDLRGKSPIIVTEQQADPVDLLYKAYQRLDAGERRRLLKRIARS
jgi:hypothetical protein